MIRVHWSDEDDAHVATSDDHPSLSWIDPDLTVAALSLAQLIEDIEAGRA